MTWMLIKRIEVKLSENFLQLFQEKGETEKSFSEISKPSRDSSVSNRGFWKGSGVVKDHVYDSKLASGLVDFLRKEKVFMI
jgi:hypothetical protein